MLPLFLGNKDGRNESSFWALLTTVLAILAVARTALPTEWLRFFRRLGARLFAYLDPYSTYTFHEFAGSSPDQNYERVKTYLSGRGVQDARRVLVSQPKNASSPVYALADNEAFIDDFEGVKFHWVHFVNQRSGTIVAVDSSVVEETRSFQLKVLAKHQHIVQKYVGHIIKRAAELEQLNRELLIYNYSAMGGWRGGKGRLWDSQPFKHPATFDTLALDHQLKAQVVNRLEAFRKNAAFYTRTGRAHKMGFFLFGPPGCGKTSFVAAVANHLHYDVYDLDLSTVRDNSSLRGLLTQIGDKAVVVVEDIDTVELPDRRSAASTPPEGRMGRDKRGGGDDEGRSTLTLGGVLNFADGLRSSSGSERIFIFTTNHPERLDPALIRPGLSHAEDFPASCLNIAMMPWR
ncbi:hypothetical protein WJX84_008256 [Apatococcus fuscideae]|uniref:AAA+ ATPase domain-containing protein n=1 Tax=Apatococcus fuscideae TaxID=2026836 RepID=A0AAW1S8X3_9CHLO